MSGLRGLALAKSRVSLVLFAHAQGSARGSLALVWGPSCFLPVDPPLSVFPPAQEECGGVPRRL